MTMRSERVRRRSVAAFTRLIAALVAAVSFAACGGAPASNASRAPEQSGRGSPPATASPATVLTQSSLVEDCTPCTFNVGPSLADFRVTFKIRELPDGRRVVDSLEISRTDRPDRSQSLPVHDMTPTAKGDDFFIGTDDINFDGYRDLSFATSRGVANTYSDYWLFDPAKSEFVYLGKYPVFKVDAQRRELSTYERGGDGGMIYTSERYAIENGKPVLMASETQEKTGQEGVYKRSVSERRAGKMEIVKTESVRPPK
jgi:hypothetical protein